ncbi:MATE family efflux transporter [Labrenzia sp. 011]|uniref:MATE family efflux transporter n=1 Tax=Labrenzia sp. 011 TaxID=2171494 RepID=UPI000D511F62|nr:MATE family efflux transporter [Labrenzia sp. 011]PVB63023.1 MATE family efflux transporter [Labrenzia sp. 011]
MSSDTSRMNTYTQGPLAGTLARTALPIILVMGMNGLMTVADAVFLGIFVGPQALSAVTLMFPAYMLLAALSTLVSSGMSSELARHLGGGRTQTAQAVFAGAHWLALCVSGLVIALYLSLGHQMTLAAAEGSVPIAGMADTYLSITVWFSPLLFILSINADALRSEGRVILMAGLSLLVSLANIGLNFVLVGLLDFGVAGTAYGTGMAQLLAFVLLLGFRLRGRTVLRPGALVRFPPASHWAAILALGAPQSLSFIGIALGSAATFAMLQHIGAPGYETTVAAFGIITRIMTFAYLPFMGLTQALQAMIGNNYGAGLWQRSDDTLRLGLAAAFLYCASVQTVLSLLAGPIGFLFVDDRGVAGEVARILPTMTALYFAAGPLFVVAMYFQAVGDALRAALLSLAKPYLFFLPLVLMLPLLVGEPGIWLASPLGEALLALLTLSVLSVRARRGPARWGLFRAARAEQTMASDG